MTTETDSAAIASFLADADSDVVPEGYIKVGDVVEDGTPEDGGRSQGDVKIEDLAFKGYVRVWDNRTGREVLQPRWILWQTFQLKREDGSRMYSPANPNIKPDYGLDLVCILHPDSPDNNLLTGMGFKPCFKTHTPTRVALNDHMRLSHKRASAVIKERMSERERAEDRALQLETIRSNQELIRAVAGQRAVAVAPTAVAPPTEAPTPEAKASPNVGGSCPDCDFVVKGERKNPAAGLASHRRAKHPKS